LTPTRSSDLRNTWGPTTNPSGISSRISAGIAWSPPCLEAAEDGAPDGITIDKETGAVLYDKDNLKKIKPETVIEACPFDIPRAQEKTGFLANSTMCVHRVHKGLLPACVKTCPTGAMNFGDRDKMVDMAKKRQVEVKGKYPKATLTGIEDLRVFYLLADDPGKYHVFAKADVPSSGMDNLRQPFPT
jgi:formate dehydrogenase iron-sulfur subunit